MTEKHILQGKVISNFVEGYHFEILPLGVIDTDVNRFGASICPSCHFLEEYEGKKVRIQLTIEVIDE